MRKLYNLFVTPGTNGGLSLAAAVLRSCRWGTHVSKHSIRVSNQDLVLLDPISV